MTALAPVDAATIIAARQFIAERVSPDARGQFLSGKHDHFAVIQACAAAILAERERCAQIAEGAGRDASRDRDIFVMTGVAGLSRVIAAAIRTTHLPSGAAACSADTPAVTLLPTAGDQFKSDGPKSRPGDAAASHTQIEQQLATGKTSAQERSSDRSGGQFGDAPKPATLSTAGV